MAFDYFRYIFQRINDIFINISLGYLYSHESMHIISQCFRVNFQTAAKKTAAKKSTAKAEKTAGTKKTTKTTARKAAAKKAE